MKNHSSRRIRGSSTIELSLGLILILPVMLVMIDICFLVVGAALNDSACRDAARACASGPPAEVTVRANGILQQLEKPGGAVQNLKLASTYPKNDITNIPTADIGGPVTGTVTVRTTVDVYPPFLVGNLLPNKFQRMRATQTYPYTYVVPCTIASD